MIEIVLNFAWLLIAFAISAAFLPRNRGRIAAVVAVSCLIALLFPIVSISDDLSPVRDAVEECGGVRRCLLSAGSCAATGVHQVGPLLAVAASASTLPILLTVLDGVEVIDATAHSPLLAARTNPRSPPSA